MKFPSLTSLAETAQTTITRFPFVLLSGLIGAIAIMCETKDERYMAVSCLGISFLFAIALFSERRGWGLPLRLAAQGIGIGLLILYFLSLPPELDLVAMIRYLLFLVGAHLLAAFAPYTRRGEVEEFWRYNEILFLRALTSALFTGVLYGGLALALLSIERLFNVTVSSSAYRDLGVLLLGLFSTGFFLAGVPENFQSLGEGGAYPRGLKIFTQYVLLPLVFIYLVILYLYAGKILVNWGWPNGWVSSLVIGFAVAGILSALLLWPIRDQDGNLWIRRFSSGFYWALIPLVVLLLLAIWRRVSDYGITEGRYFVIATALWLAGIAIYFIVSRRDNIKVIPISLCILAFLGSFGPWSAFNVAVESQVGQLHELFVRHHVIGAEGTIIPIRKGDTIGSDEQSRVYSILYFLEEHHMLKAVGRWLPGARVDTMDMAQLIEHIGLGEWTTPGYDAHGYDDSASGPFELAVDEFLRSDHTIAVSGFDIVHTIDRGLADSDGETFVVGDQSYTLRYEKSSGALRLDAGPAGIALFTLPAIIDSAVASLRALGDSIPPPNIARLPTAMPKGHRFRIEERLPAIPGALMTVDGTGGPRTRLVLTQATVMKVGGRTTVTSFEGYLLIGAGKPAAAR